MERTISDKTPILVRFQTKNKLEEVKKDYETTLGKICSWDDLFAHLIRVEKYLDK